MSSAARTQWLLPNAERAVVRSLATGLGVQGIVAQILVSRGLTDVQQARAFLEGHHLPLSDPFALTGMRDAVDRIGAAQQRGEHVRVFGDYDVDGMAATAVLTRGLRRFGLRDVSHAMPNRLTEGYGINRDSVVDAARDGVNLLITVDNGINAFDAAEEAARRGIDLIVTDHHTIDEALPQAVAVINPHRDDPAAPFAFACGSAVAFSLCRALTDEDSDLDLVALATVADVVPLRRENRLIVARGLGRIAERAHPGLEALARCAKLNPREIRAEHIAFQLAPRLNASGRLGDGSAALALMLSDSHGEADALAQELDRLNRRRREVEDAISQEALARIEQDRLVDRRTIVLAGRTWHPGVIGIVSARLMGAFGRPVVLIAVDDGGTGRASGRSTPDLHLAEALAACGDLLEKHGGHRLAAGMTIREDRIPEFAERFEAYAAQTMPADPSPATLSLDAIVALSEVNEQLIQTIDRLEPFGAENPAPVFAAFGVRLPRKNARTLRGGHLQCQVAHGDREFPAIGFSLAGKWRPEEMPECVDVAFRPRFNTWRGTTTIQLQLLDLRPAADAVPDALRAK